MKRIATAVMVLMVLAGWIVAEEKYLDKQTATITNETQTYTYTKVKSGFPALVAFHWENGCNGTAKVEVVSASITNVIYTAAHGTTVKDVQVGLRDTQWYFLVNDAIRITSESTNACTVSVWRKR